MSARRAVRVVAALIGRADGAVLITQRRPQAFMPLKWEFPGGKVEPGESDQQALCRELAEELGIEIEVGELFMGLVHSYPDFDVDFNVYRCCIVGGKPRCLAVHDMKWVPIEDLEEHEFPPADQPTIERLIGE
ncbi:MAG: 8-oxo-dGTP diphosphatase MutT [Deltaproteobacteria bacterium]|nr:8-oxo-dGTP diphosphatase MutT [Deltaproteobacteria bacterium]